MDFWQNPFFAKTRHQLLCTIRQFSFVFDVSLAFPADVNLLFKSVQIVVISYIGGYEKSSEGKTVVKKHPWVVPLVPLPLPDPPGLPSGFS